jgi:3-hydroxybutyryl-CoA dehydrogenase
MKLAVIANEILKEELLATGKAAGCNFVWLTDAANLAQHSDADAVIDLVFEHKPEHADALKTFLPRPVIVNTVVKTTDEIKFPFIRINGWPTFLKRPVAELACKQVTERSAAEKIFAALNRKAEWVPDVKGFVSARVVSMIINEAFFALQENVSQKEEIDMAMKLGTNYPYGPFEWAGKIGLKNIAALLKGLSEIESRYKPAALLLKEAAEE